jgi:catechol 2,3-dioxygenase-like lactoylglutathione lyase family enzyme
MIDHTGVTVTDFERSKRFYELALKPLGYSVMAEFPREDGGKVLGMGELDSKKPDFWVVGGAPQPGHIAFRANSRSAVEQFHAAALAAGGRDNGAPGVRPHYHPNYYGAFVLDPDGYNIEAVCHGPPR